MKLQEHADRFVTSTGLLIAAFVYFFLFVAAALSFPLVGEGYHDTIGLRALSFLDAYMLPRRSLRGRSPNLRLTRTTHTFATTRELRRAVDHWLDDRDKAMERYGPMSAWNVSLIRDMAFLFEDIIDFHEDLSAWDISNVVNMSGMFARTKYFEASISPWNTSLVQDFSCMFEDSSFAEDISKWDVKAGTNFSFMFHRAESFNADLSQWSLGPDVASVASLFEGAASFHSDLSRWQIPESTNTTDMFKDASSFDLRQGPGPLVFAATRSR